MSPETELLRQLREIARFPRFRACSHRRCLLLKQRAGAQFRVRFIRVFDEQSRSAFHTATIARRNT